MAKLDERSTERLLSLPQRDMHAAQDAPRLHQRKGATGELAIVTPSRALRDRRYARPVAAGQLPPAGNRPTPRLRRHEDSRL